MRQRAPFSAPNSTCPSLICCPRRLRVRFRRPRSHMATIVVLRQSLPPFCWTHHTLSCRQWRTRRRRVIQHRCFRPQLYPSQEDCAVSPPSSALITLALMNSSDDLNMLSVSGFFVELEKHRNMSHSFFCLEAAPGFVRL